MKSIIPNPSRNRRKKKMIAQIKTIMMRISFTKVSLCLFISNLPPSNASCSIRFLKFLKNSAIGLRNAWSMALSRLLALFTSHCVVANDYHYYEEYY